MWPAPSTATRPIPSRPTCREPRNHRGSGGPKAPFHRDRDGFIAKTKPCTQPMPRTGAWWRPPPAPARGPRPVHQTGCPCLPTDPTAVVLPLRRSLAWGRWRTGWTRALWRGTSRRWVHTITIIFSIPLNHVASISTGECMFSIDPLGPILY
jgi:hypothetical protein